MLSRTTRSIRRRLTLTAALLSTGVIPLIPFLPSCEALVNRFEPCGTIFGNCVPGDFQLQFADVPDFTFDPSCTIPLQCGVNPFQDISFLAGGRP